MSGKREREQKPREYPLYLNGRPATEAEYKRIMGVRTQKSKKSRETAPIETVSREFRLMR